MIDIIAAALDEQLCVRGDGGCGIKIMNGARRNVGHIVVMYIVGAVMANIDLCNRSVTGFLPD